jgi:hypothetical protein
MSQKKTLKPLQLVTKKKKEHISTFYTRLVYVDYTLVHVYFSSIKPVDLPLNNKQNIFLLQTLTVLLFVVIYLYTQHMGYYNDDSEINNYLMSSLLQLSVDPSTNVNSAKILDLRLL